MIHTVKIPLKLDSLNDYIDKNRTNWNIGNNYKKSIQRTIMLYFRKLPKIEKPVKIHITWVEVKKNRDPDNIAFAKKFILDALVKAGKLPNDNHRWIKGFSDNFDFSKESEIILKIEEVEE